ncbi:MAG: magnesium transporter [Acidimicrobiales bacterium]
MSERPAAPNRSRSRVGRLLVTIGALRAAIVSSITTDDDGQRGRRRLAVPRLAWRPLGGLLGPAVGDASQSLGALALSATTSLITGFTFAFFADTLRSNPGLLMFIPAAIGLRGNVFGPLGSRLSTALQAGTLTWSWKRDSLLGQNVIGALASSLVAALGLSIVAEVVAQLITDQSISVLGIADFVVVSVLGGSVASLVVLAITIGLAVAATRFGWDLDNVMAPLVSASGDFVTLPAIVVTTSLISRGWLTRSLASIMALLVIVVAVLVIRSTMSTAKRILLEAIPILMVAGTMSLIAGIVLERSVDRFLTFSVLIVLLPGYLSTAGALGGILSSRLSTKVHLGLIRASKIPQGDARDDIRVTFALALPIFVLLAVLAGTLGVAAGRSSPGLFLLTAVAATGGLVATTFVAIVAYYGTFAAVRFGLDPDSHGIPLVSASLDVVGAATLIGALVLWGVA